MTSKSLITFISASPLSSPFKEVLASKQGKVYTTTLLNKLSIFFIARTRADSSSSMVRYLCDPPTSVADARWHDYELQSTTSDTSRNKKRSRSFWLVWANSGNPILCIQAIIPNVGRLVTPPTIPDTSLLIMHT